MDLTGISKLYAPDGREYQKLYDNKGNLIWQGAITPGTVLWSGHLYIGTGKTDTIILNADYQGVVNGLQFTMLDADNRTQTMKIAKAQSTQPYLGYIIEGTYIVWQISMTGRTVTIKSVDSYVSGYGTWQEIKAY